MNRHFFLLLILISIIFGCGQKHPGTVAQQLGQSDIIGGTLAAENEFPFLANLWLNSPKDSYNSHHCGGSLIHPKWVLTAAHCLIEDKSESTTGPIDVKSFTLFFSSLRADGQGGLQAKVKRIVIHPQFSWPNHDIALIELAERIEDITPITLAQTDSPLPNEATVAGWGLTDANGLFDASLLLKVTLPLTDRKTCNQDFFPKKRGWVISQDMLCAQTQNNHRASCPGDSGGPLFAPINGQIMQFGVVSWGSACRKTHGESVQSNIEVYADVADAYPWLEKIISN